jgi:hypothetical protein
VGNDIMENMDVLRDACILLVISNNIDSHLVSYKARRVNFLPRGILRHVRGLL